MLSCADNKPEVIKQMNDRKDRIRVHIENREFSVVGGAFKDMLVAIKQVTGRRFVGELKVWQLPGSAEDIQNQLEISSYYLEGGKPLADTPPPTATTAKTAPHPGGGDRIRVIIQEKQLTVVGGGFQEMLAAVKTVPGRRFDGERKVWELSGDPAIIKQLIESAGFQIEGIDQIAFGPVGEIETPNFNPSDTPPPAYEEPIFMDSDDIPPYEPPAWWDDDNAPPPDLEPPDWLDDELAQHPPDESPLFDDSAPPSPPSPAPVSSQAIPTAPRNGDQIRIRVGGIPLLVVGGDFRSMLEAIKKIPGRRFDGQDKVWDIPADIGIESVQQSMNAAGFMITRG